MTHTPIVVIKTGTAEAIVHDRGDFEDWIAAKMGPVPTRTSWVSKGHQLPDLGSVSGVVVTGSPAMVTARHEWSERSAEWMRRAVEHCVPVLGICFGHQLLAHALGGRVGTDPAGREIGTKAITLRPEADADPLMAGLPDAFPAHTTHLESVLELPPGARWLASSAHTPLHAFRVGDCAWGVQFHPEFDAEIMAAYIRARTGELHREGLDPNDLLHQVAETPVAHGLLARFASLV